MNRLSLFTLAASLFACNADPQLYAQLSAGAPPPGADELAPAAPPAPPESLAIAPSPSVVNVLEIRSRMSNGDGSWRSVAQQFPGDGPSVLNGAVLAGDVNGDGRKDLVLAFGNGSGALEIRTKLAKGDGTWTSAVQTFPDGSGVLGGKVMMGDVDNDGKADVILAFANTWTGGGALEIRTKLSNGDGTWRSAGQSFPDSGSILGGKAAVMATDVNGDGRPDVVIAFANAQGALEIRTKFSSGDGSWLSRAQVLPDASSVLDGKVLTGDVNHDGRADLIIAFANAQGALEIRTKFSNGDGTWTSVAQTFTDSGSILSGYSSVMAGDVNADGKTDVIIAFANGLYSPLEIRAKLSDGFGAWASTSTVFGDGGGIFAGKVLPADVNRDGKTDVVFAVSNTWTGGGALEIRTKFSNGDGTWISIGAGFNEKGESLTKAVLPADIDGDGRTDLVSAFVSQS